MRLKLRLNHKYILRPYDALAVAKATPRRFHAQTKTHLEAAAFLSLPADIHRDGVSSFSDAGTAAAGDRAGAGAVDTGEEARSGGALVRARLAVAKRGCVRVLLVRAACEGCFRALPVGHGATHTAPRTA